ncbi:MAG: hypothetical protein FJX57_05545 [Alphaproteobacteria bacterium]|nr:hypothetical protein [Alphaproteobacteria bacterium]
MTAARILTGTSVTKLGPEHVGAAMVAGSHAGIIAAYLAAKAGLRAVILNDAGVGLDRAGIAGLDYLEKLAIPAAAVDCRTARIGDGADMHARGIISHANPRAQALGVRPGERCAEAIVKLAAAPEHRAEAPHYEEARYKLRERPGEPAVWGLDSVSLVRPDDATRILMIGSHGALLGGDPASAIRGEAIAAVFNDAGVGIDGAGITRLPALDPRRIPAAAVDVMSARIGDARSTWETGILTHVNAVAAALGAKPGITAQAFADLVVARGRRS